MIASRKIEQLQSTANELQQHLPTNGTAELDYMVCNIRNEDQVMMYLCRLNYSIINVTEYCYVAMLCLSLIHI